MNIWTERFRQDLYTKMFMAHTTTKLPRLYVRSDWHPPINMVNYNLQLHVNNFTTNIQQLFRKKQARSNMLPYQRHILAELRNSKQHIAINAAHV
jgi:hypothetical protein